MKIPKEINTYCPYCNAKRTMKVKNVSRGRVRKTAEGQKRPERKTKGYTSKVAGEKKVYKQAKKQVVILTCKECGKKQQRTVGGRTKKKIEIKSK